MLSANAGDPHPCRHSSGKTVGSPLPSTISVRIWKEPCVSKPFISISQCKVLRPRPCKNRFAFSSYLVSGWLDDPVIHVLGGVDLRAIDLSRGRTLVVLHVIQWRWDGAFRVAVRTRRHDAMQHDTTRAEATPPNGYVKRKANLVAGRRPRFLIIRSRDTGPVSQNYAQWGSRFRRASRNFPSEAECWTKEFRSGQSQIGSAPREMDRS